MAILISIIAPPGAGKTTVLNAVAAEHNIPKLSSGDIARELEAEKQANYLKDGNLAPEDELRAKLKVKLTDLFEKHPVVLADGFPRFCEQYEWLKSTFAEHQIVLFNMDEPQSVLLERILSRGRADDTSDAFQTRMKVYNELTHPIVKEYNVPKYNYDYLAQIISSNKK